MFQFFLTILIAFVLFLLFGAALMLGFWSPKRPKRRCECAAAKEILQQFVAKEQAAKQAALYAPKTVDPNHLPLIDESLKPQQFR